MTVSVVTDSAAAVPAELLNELAIQSVPAWISIGGRQITETETTGQEVLDRWEEGVSTSTPTPEDFSRIYSRSNSDEILVVTVSSSLTGVFQSATIAAQDHGKTVRVVDSRTAVGAQALIVLSAARAAARGLTLQAVAAEAEMVKRATTLVATLEDLSHLVRSGRVPGVARWAGRSLKIHPIVELGEGKARVVRPALSRSAAIERIIARAMRSRRSSDSRIHVASFHSLDPEAAVKIEAGVTSEIEPAESLVCEFGPAMMVHAGAGVAGLAWWWENPGDG